MIDRQAKSSRERLATVWQHLVCEWAFGEEPPLIATVDWFGRERDFRVCEGGAATPNRVYVSPVGWS